jgi:conjugative relaxase-like TrwC/TraI family protein
MTATVTAAGGYDLGYVWKNQAQGKDAEREQGKGGYYINAAQHGEPPGRWFGRGAEALGLAGEVDREPYDKVYRQVHPRDGSKLGRAPGTYQQKHDVLLALKEAEPHATSERVAELERIAAAAARKSPAYTDVTVSLVKSVSIFHASVRENERQARLAGDEPRAAWWAAREAEVQEALQNANRAAMRHLQDWAVTRTGHHGARVDGQEPGKYEPAGLAGTSWLQGTSRDGDPQDHIHNQIARMSRTDRDGRWRAVDTMAVRAQLGAVRAIFGAHLRAEMTQRFDVEWVPRKDGDGQEIKGITRAQIEKYSTRTQRIGDKTRDLVDAWTREHGQEPNRRQLLYLQQAATMASRENKPEGDINWDDYLAKWAPKWEAGDGSSLAAVAGKVSSLRGPDDAPREPGSAQATDAQTQLSADAQTRVMQAALARVQQREPAWTRADLMREIADCMPPEAAQMTPADSVALVDELTGRAIAGEAGQVVSLEAPDHLDTPGYLIRELDGKSMYTRPGVERFTTGVQIAREEELLATAAKEGAPHLTRERAAQLLGATPGELEAAARTRASEPTRQLPNGMSMAQAAALYQSLTSDRTGYPTVGPAGTGKTHVAAMAARMWPDDVVFLAPSQAAANVLRQATGNRYPVYNNAQFLGHTEDERGVRGPVPIGPRTLILMDESSMTPIADLGDVARYAADNDSTFRLFGDDGQLTAPEGGGGLPLLTRNQEHVQLAEPKRFEAAWEADASLRLRGGDTAILDEYEQQGRIRGGGTLDEVMDEAARQYLAGYLQGKDVLLMTQSNDHARELSARIRDELQHLGLVGRGSEASLREGAKASAGDLIVTRKNDHDQGIANGDAWRVEHVNGDTITMRKMLDADRETGERRFAGETVTYEAAKEGADLAYAEDLALEDEQGEASRPADLGYSVTGHTGQGRTVWQGNALFTGTENRNWAYPALTRGTNGNYAWVVGQPPKVADPAPGTRAAPELERQARVERERAGLPAEPRTLTALEKELAREPKDVLADVLERDGTVYSALETRQRNLANADHLGRLHAIWEGETREPVNARYERELRGQLPDHLKDAKLSGHATWLYRTLRDAEAAGLDSKGMLARAVGSQPLTGTRDVAAVVDARVRGQASGLVPQQPRPWAERVPEDDRQDRREYLTRVGKAMDDRARRLGEHTAEAKPPWAERAFGPVPDGAGERQAWQDRAAPVAAYREMFGWGDPDEPIGPEPVNSPEARQQWHAAFAALGPVDGQDLRGLADGQLLLRRDAYERETAWAPQWVAGELRQARTGADDADRNAVLSAARAEAARKQEEHEQASLHDALARSQRAMAGQYRGLEARFAATMEARKDWEETTRQQRHDALAAHTEYVRRHPGTDLPPLKSAEPERPAEEEQTKLNVPELEPWEPPAWLADMTERTRKANEEIADRRSMKVPDEDPELPGRHAWPASMTLTRDAILQPPPPQIPPAAEVAERAAQMDREAGG